MVITSLEQETAARDGGVALHGRCAQPPRSVGRTARSALLAACACVSLAISAPALGAQAPLPSANDSVPRLNLPPNAHYLPHRVARGKSFTDFEAMLQELAQADVVYLGEEHDDRGTHALQLAVLEGLARRGVSVVLSLEMIERDAQPALDAYLAGTMPESAFLADSRPWPNYQPDYRPLVEFAKAHEWPVVASNIPRGIASSVSRGGLAALDTLIGEAAGWVAAERACGPNGKYARKFGKTMEDMGGHGGPAMTPEMIARFYEAQCMKDETMAESVGRALDAHPNAVVVHVAGGFHVAEALGTVERVERRAKRGDIQRKLRDAPVVMFVPTADLSEVDAGKNRKLGTFVVYPLR